MFISGDKSKSFRDTKSIYNSWSVSRGRKNEADDWTKHNIYLIVTESAHDGIASVMKHSDFIPDTIFDFLENRVFNRVEEYGHKTRSTGKSPTPPVLIDGAAGDGQAIAPGPGAPIAPGAGPPPGGNAPPAAPPRKGGGL
jgi:hypothetical protein